MWLLVLCAVRLGAAEPPDWFGAVIDAPAPAVAGLRGPGFALLRSIGELHLAELTETGLARATTQVGHGGVRRIVMVDGPQRVEPPEAPGPGLIGRGPLPAGEQPFPRSGLSGKGVLVGVIDSGLDIRHPALRDAQGRTRVLEAWDQTLAAGRWGAGAPVEARVEAWGCVLDQAGVTRLLALPQPPALVDLEGHGTAAAGTAVGSAADDHPNGVAPAADLLVVKTASGVESPVMNYLLGLAWMADRAEQLGRPCVVNMSFTGLNSVASGLAQELVLAALARRHPHGFVMVAAAGNDGGRARHAAGRLRVGGEPQVVGAQLEASAALAITLAPGRGCQVEVLATTPVAGVATPQPLILSWSMRANGDQQLAVRGSTLTRSSKQAIFERLRGQVEAGPLGGGRTLLSWTLPPELTGRVDVRLSRLGEGPAAADWELWLTRGGYLRTGGDQLNCVGFPARAREVLAVGSYDSTDTVPTRDGWLQLREPSAAHPEYAWVRNAPSYFSSRGFCLGEGPGDVKPDLLAPGQWVVSPLAFAGHEPSRLGLDHGVLSRRRVSGDRGYVAWHGTSAAAPYVTGLVALLLEARPQWGLDDISQALRTMVTAPEGRERLPNSTSGWGRLDPKLIGQALARLAPAADRGQP